MEGTESVDWQGDRDLTDVGRPAGVGPTRDREHPGPGASSAAPRAGHWLPAAAFVATLIVFLPLSRLRVDTHHDGIVFKPAMDVYSGQTLFKDTFSQYGPLTTYIHVATMKCFGPKLLTIRVATVFFYAGAIALLSAAWLRFLPAKVVAIGIVLWLSWATFIEGERELDQNLAMLPWSSVYALFFQASTLYGLVRMGDRRHAAWFGSLCGASTALTFWCRFSVGVLLGVAVVVVLALRFARARPDGTRSRAATIACLAAAAAVHAGFLLQLASASSLDDWYAQNIAFPLKWSVLVDAAHNPLTVERTLPREDMEDPHRLAVTGFQRAIKIYYDLFTINGLTQVAQRRVRIFMGFHYKLDDQIVFLASVAVLTFTIAAAILSGRRPRRPDAKVSRSDAPALMVTAALVAAAASLAGRRMATIPWGYVVPVGVCAWTGAALIHWALAVLRRAPARAGESAAIACGVVALSSWAQYYPVAEPLHVFFAAGPMIGAFCAFALRLGRGRDTLVAVALLIAVVPLLAVRGLHVVEQFRTPYVKLGPGSVLSGMLVEEERAGQWESLLDAIREYERAHGKVAVLNESRDALFAALGSDLSNPTPFPVNWLGLPHPADHERRRDDFIRVKRPLIFVNTGFLVGKADLGEEFARKVARVGYRPYRVYSPQKFAPDYTVLRWESRINGFAPMTDVLYEPSDIGGGGDGRNSVAGRRP